MNLPRREYWLNNVQIPSSLLNIAQFLSGFCDKQLVVVDPYNLVTRQNDFDWEIRASTSVKPPWSVYHSNNK